MSGKRIDLPAATMRCMAAKGIKDLAELAEVSKVPVRTLQRYYGQGMRLNGQNLTNLVNTLAASAEDYKDLFQEFCAE